MATIERTRPAETETVSFRRRTIATPAHRSRLRQITRRADDVEVAVPGMTSRALLSLGTLWPFILILAVISLIVPWLGGLVVVGLLGALLVLPYRLVRRAWRDR